MPAKYDKIGDAYNQTRQADHYLTGRLIHHLQPEPGKIYLDIGCGTGNYTHALHQHGIRLMGIDPSENMLREARTKNSSIDWRTGSAENTNLTDRAVDGIIAILTIHHWRDLRKGFAELKRILKENGRIVIFTSTPEQMNGYWLNRYFPKMLSDSKQQMPSLSAVQNAMITSGFKISSTEKYFVWPDLQDHFLYCGKHRPELYLQPAIRRGISSFASLADLHEVESGLAELKSDITSGKIQQVIMEFENDMGDYLFIVGEHPSQQAPGLNTSFSG